MRVGADFHVAAVLPLVHEGVHVADDREGDLALRLLEERDRADGDHLVHGWRERDAAPAMRAIRGLQTPQQTKTYSVSIGPLSVWTRRMRPFSTSMPVTSVLAETVSAPSASRGLAHQRAGADRVDDADAGRVEAAEQDLLVDVRHELLHLRRRQ